MSRTGLPTALAVAALLLLAHCTNTILVETVTVPSNLEWSAATSHALTPGTAFTIEVDQSQKWTSGSWTGTADGDIPQWGDYSLPGAKAYSLIGRIGSDGEPFFIGTRYEGVAAAGGALELAMNDVPGTYWDNRGKLTVVVTVP
jgi:hypothetical protein